MKRNAAIGALVLIVMALSVGYLYFCVDNSRDMPLVAGLLTSEPKVQHQQIGSGRIASRDEARTGTSGLALADQDFTQAMLRQTSSSAPIADNAYERLDEVRRESISESVQRLDSEQFSPISMKLLERSFFDPVSKQARILHQPRVARVLLAAVQGGPEVREVILNETVNQVSQHIEEIKQGRAGQLTTLSSSRHQGVAFPIILSEVDDTGSSLPLLLEWYDLSSEGARRSIEALRESGEILPHDSGKARSEVMNLIAPAVFEISESLGVGILKFLCRGSKVNRLIQSGACLKLSLRHMGRP